MSALLASLPPRDADMVERSVIFGETFREIGASHGVNKSVASRAVREALVRLRGHPAAVG